MNLKNFSLLVFASFALLMSNVAAQTIHKIPVASHANIIELTIANPTHATLSSVSVGIKNLPEWIQMKAPEKIIPIIKANGEQSVSFEFSIAKDAPAGRDQMLDFDVTTQAGDKWTKRITISVTPPERFSLLQNYPNPFNPTTRFDYTLPVDGMVLLKVFNVLGQEVATVVDEFQTAGYKSIEFDGASLSSGLYFYRIQAGRFVDIKKMMLIK